MFLVLKSLFFGDLSQNQTQKLTKKSINVQMSESKRIKRENYFFVDTFDNFLSNGRNWGIIFQTHRRKVQFRTKDWKRESRDDFINQIIVLIATKASRIQFEYAMHSSERKLRRISSFDNKETVRIEFAFNRNFWTELEPFEPLEVTVDQFLNLN